MGLELAVCTLKLQLILLPFRLHLVPCMEGGKRDAEEDMGGILGVVRFSVKGKKVMVLNMEGLVMELESSKPKKLLMVLVVLGLLSEEEHQRWFDFRCR